MMYQSELIYYDPQTEEEIRLVGLHNLKNVEEAFIWKSLQRDFIREIIEQNKKYKTQLEHKLLMAFHGYVDYPSNFYQNMYHYLDMGLAEAKDLAYYKNQLYLLYKEKRELEYNSRQVFRITNGTGRVLDTYVC